MNSHRTLSILITDDIAQNRAYLSQLFQSILKNAQIQEAENGERAIELVTQQMELTKASFDLIIMDFKMPKLNGEEATTAIREREKAVKPEKQSIIITWSSAKEAPYPGADDWMPKVVDRIDLERKLIALGLM
jgi:CheY-like chemotaxis protein